MKHQCESAQDRATAPLEQPRAEHAQMTTRQLAHELNSLLDGAARCVRQVQALLATPVENREPKKFEQKLDMALNAIRQMAELLERAMNAPESNQNMLSNERPLGEFVPDLIASLRPKADEHRIVFNLHMTNDAAAVQTGAMGSVLLNGLTNAIDACASSPTTPRIIEVSISINSHQELVVLISDTGPGVIDSLRASNRSIPSTKPDGHGIGLELCRQIIGDLGGRMELTNIPFGAGAIFQVRVPLPRLCAA